MQPAATEPAPPLPELRQELRLERDNVLNRWLLHDPIRGRFHTLGQAAFTALSHWNSIPPDVFIARLNQAEPELGFTEDELQHLTEFLLSEKLLDQKGCLLYTSPSPRDGLLSRMPSSA